MSIKKVSKLKIILLVICIVITNCIVVCGANIPPEYNDDYFITENVDDSVMVYQWHMFAYDTDPNRTMEETYTDVYVPANTKCCLAMYMNNGVYEFRVVTGDTDNDGWYDDYISVNCDTLIHYKEGATQVTKQSGSNLAWRITSSLYQLGYSNMYVFDSYENAVAYVKEGTINGCLQEPCKKYDVDNIYLDNFRVIYHDSNVLESCYIEVKYNIPQYLQDNINDAVLNVGIDYNCQAEILSGVKELDCSAFDVSTTKSYDLSLYPTGFNLYLSEFATGNEIQKQMMLGDELYVDFSGLSVGDLGANSIGQITKSMIYMSLYPNVGASGGLSYDAQVDLLNPSNTSYYSSTPDAGGNYTSNNNYTQGGGYYTTIVGTDGQGNATYNYYYYDNSTHTTITLDSDFDTDVGFDDEDIITGTGGSDTLTVLWGNPLTVQGSIDGGAGGSGGSGGNVTINGSGEDIDLTIEDDDYTDAALREDLRDGFGLLDNMDTEQSSDGFLQLSAKFYEHLDGDLDDMLVFGMSSVIVICILRSIFRR